MHTECSAEMFEFAPVEGRQVVAGFDGGTITSDAGALLLGATDGAIRLTERFAGCFTDRRVPELVEHRVRALLTQRVVGIALGYEDLTDHDELRHDPVLAVLAGKLAARRSDCAALAGKSTLNRLELSQTEPTRYHRISHDGAGIEALFVDLFLAHIAAPRSRSSSTSTPPTIRCTATKRAGSSTAITTASATCRFTCSAAATCSPPSFAGRTSTHPPERWRRLRALFRRSASAGHGYGSCCVRIPASPESR